MSTPVTRERLAAALAGTGGQPVTAEHLIDLVVAEHGRGMAMATAERQLDALVEEGRAARVGVDDQGGALWAYALLPADVGAPAPGGSPLALPLSERIVNALADAGWFSVAMIHVVLANEPAGDVPHEVLTEELARLVSVERLERRGLTPPRWRVLG